MSRPPRSFEVDEPSPVQKTERLRAPRALDVPTEFVAADDAAAQRVDGAELAALEPPPPPPSARRFSFAKLLFLALSALASLAVGLAIDELIRELFARQDWLGWFAVGLGGIALMAALAIVIRELVGLRRLARIEALRERAVAAAASADPAPARKVLEDLDSLYADDPATAGGRTALASTRHEIYASGDLLRLAERDLLAPLDARARNMTLNASKRVSVVTAVSPRAFIDIGFVLIENLRLMRRIADLYGGRPGTLGFLRLARNIVGHLAVTGSIAVGDSMIQQVVGHGLAARLSSRLGEGVVNGLLTARVGIAAIDVCRPLPFLHTTRPGVSDFVADLTRPEHNRSPSSPSPQQEADR